MDIRDRPHFLHSAAPALLLAGASPAPARKPAAAREPQKEEEVTPTEDLMREHGLLKRVLLVYDEVRRRIAANAEFPPDAVTGGAKIIRSFIEEYHEQLEEKHLFPRFRSHRTLVDLVEVLEEQHKAGRRVTERILALAGGGLKGPGDRKDLAALLESFTRMYAPHEAREDTVLFPALRRLVSAHEYDALGETFEDEEHRKFGQEGFEGMVERVALLEKTLGIYDLRQFTPR
ncbi:MAG: hemerythrin domain-containing protein [Acidobacteria bacterium]|nr:MAG: hemerythrin domain-containing protein [Acidobacteriota bacterium]